MPFCIVLDAIAYLLQCRKCFRQADDTSVQEQFEHSRNGGYTQFVPFRQVTSK